MRGRGPCRASDSAPPAAAVFFTRQSARERAPDSAAGWLTADEEPEASLFFRDP